MTTRNALGKFWLNSLRLAAGAACVAATAAQADPAPPGWQADGLELVGFSALGGHAGAFKLAIKQSGGHWYLYMGHSFEPGWSILEVTNPADPKYLKFIPGPEGLVTSQVSLHDNLLLAGVGSVVAEPGGPRPKSVESGVLFFDISDPVNPRQIGDWKTGPSGTHRNSYPGGKYAFLSANVAGYRSRILDILDVSDPTHPKEAGRFALPGQRDNEPQPPVPPGFHGPASISPDGKMATMGYAPDIINLDISDIAHPKLIGSLTMTPPFPSVGIQSEHTVLPLWDRKLLFASSEAMASGCDKEPMHYAVLIDNKDPAKPRLMSFFPTPRPPKDAPYATFCDKGGRFGPHNVSTEIHAPDVQKPGDMMYIAYFNAGLRAFSIANPRMPVETGWFIPSERSGVSPHAGPHKSPINWSEDVLVDTRGTIYVSDDKWGIWILRDPKHPLGK